MNDLTHTFTVDATPQEAYEALLALRNAITDADKQSDSAYNTYRFPGLVPTPISDSKESRPPCRSATWRTIDSPSPEPGIVRAARER